MSALDANLALWTETYARLQDAKARLTAARAMPMPDARIVQRLADEVRGLEAESETALGNVQRAFTTMKQETSKHR